MLNQTILEDKVSPLNIENAAIADASTSQQPALPEVNTWAASA